ncbi:uncharacterized protein LOC143751617 [Siphateles boraxobius]|uniref:uncharacterized protein LOC143751617 n=1 Tax=Siphateles boraxobius TaxID=180520 RepID=UPI004062BC6F
MKPMRRSKATQVRMPNRSVSCDTGTLMEPFTECPGATSTPIKRKRCEVSTDDSSYHQDGIESTMNSTSSQDEMNSQWLQDFAPYSPSSELDSSSARQDSPVSNYSWMKQEPEMEIIQWENKNSVPADHDTEQDNTPNTAVSTVIPPIMEGLPSGVMLTITKLQCLLESKQERIDALERQVQDLQEDRRFLRSQIENLTGALSTHVCRGVQDEATGKS